MLMRFEIGLQQFMNVEDHLLSQIENNADTKELKRDPSTIHFVYLLMTKTLTTCHLFSIFYARGLWQSCQTFDI